MRIFSESCVKIMKLYNLGSLNIDYVYAVDHFVRGGETLSSRKMEVFPGGKGLNQSIALAKAGARVCHGALVGDGGEFLLNTMSEAGVDIGRIEKVDGSSGHAIIQVDSRGQNCILLFAGANHKIGEDYIRRFLHDAQPGDVLLLQNEVSALEQIFAVAREKSLQIAFNPSPFGAELLSLPLEQVRWWFCNEIEAAALFGNEDPDKIAESFTRQYPHSALILTLGSRGSMYIDAHTCHRQQIYPANAVDTTAAGDTFTGYFLAAIAAGQTPEQAMDLAAKASSIAVSRPGASSSIPTLEEVK